MSEEFRQQFIGVLDPALKERLAGDAVERNVTLNDVAVELLAGRYDVPFTAAGPYRRVDTGSTTVNLKVPALLYERLHLAAIGDRLPVKALVAKILCDHYGVEFIAPARRTRRRAAV